MKNFIFLFSLILFSCSEKPKIEEGDVVMKCVVNKIVISPPHSTIEPDMKFTYHTDCGTRVITNNKGTYNIGDTITYVYKKKK